MHQPEGTNHAPDTRGRQQIGDDRQRLVLGAPIGFDQRAGRRAQLRPPHRIGQQHHEGLFELALLYQLATAVFVGGSLVDRGGHNILEPAVFGKPILFGPHMQNFEEIADTFLSNGAAVQVESEGELEEAIVTLLADPVRRARLGAAARALVEANRGAKDKTLAVIADLLPPAGVGGVVRPFRLVH